MSATRRSWRERPVRVDRVHAEARAGPGRADRPRSDANRSMYAVEVGLIGHTNRTLEALLPQLHAALGPGCLVKALYGMDDWRRLVHERKSAATRP